MPGSRGLRRLTLFCARKLYILHHCHSYSSTNCTALHPLSSTQSRLLCYDSLQRSANPRFILFNLAYLFFLTSLFLSRSTRERIYPQTHVSWTSCCGHMCLPPPPSRYYLEIDTARIHSTITNLVLLFCIHRFKICSQPVCNDQHEKGSFRP